MINWRWSVLLVNSFHGNWIPKIQMRRIVWLISRKNNYQCHVYACVGGLLQPKKVGAYEDISFVLSASSFQRGLSCFKKKVCDIGNLICPWVSDCRWIVIHSGHISVTLLTAETLCKSGTFLRCLNAILQKSFSFITDKWGKTSKPLQFPCFHRKVPPMEVSMEPRHMPLVQGKCTLNCWGNI